MGYQERLRFRAEDGSRWRALIRPDWAALADGLRHLPDTSEPPPDWLQLSLQPPDSPAAAAPDPAGAATAQVDAGAPLPAASAAARRDPAPSHPTDRRPAPGTADGARPGTSSHPSAPPEPDPTPSDPNPAPDQAGAPSPTQAGAPNAAQTGATRVDAPSPAPNPSPALADAPNPAQAGAPGAAQAGAPAASPGPTPDPSPAPNAAQADAPDPAQAGAPSPAPAPRPAQAGAPGGPKAGAPTASPGPAPAQADAALLPSFDPVRGRAPWQPQAAPVARAWAPPHALDAKPDGPRGAVGPSLDAPVDSSEADTQDLQAPGRPPRPPSGIADDLLAAPAADLSESWAGQLQEPPPQPRPPPQPGAPTDETAAAGAPNLLDVATLLSNKTASAAPIASQLADEAEIGRELRPPRASPSYGERGGPDGVAPVTEERGGPDGVAPPHTEGGRPNATTPGNAMGGGAVEPGGDACLPENGAAATSAGFPENGAEAPSARVGRLWRVQLADGRVVLLQRFQGRRLPWRRPVAEVRFQAIHSLWALGVPTARALALLCGPRGRFSWLVFEALDDPPLTTWVATASAAQRRELARMIGIYARRARDAGLHVDLRPARWCVRDRQPYLRQVLPYDWSDEQGGLRSLGEGLHPRRVEQLALLRGYLGRQLGSSAQRLRSLLGA